MCKLCRCFLGTVMDKNPSVWIAEAEPKCAFQALYMQQTCKVHFLNTYTFSFQWESHEIWHISEITGQRNGCEKEYQHPDEVLNCDDEFFFLYMILHASKKQVKLTMFMFPWQSCQDFSWFLQSQKLTHNQADATIFRFSADLGQDVPSQHTFSWSPLPFTCGKHEYSYQESNYTCVFTDKSLNEESCACNSSNSSTFLQWMNK